MVQVTPGPKLTSKNYIDSNKYLEKRASKTNISANMVKSVSQYRKDILEGEVTSGKFNGDYNTKDNLGPSAAGYVTSSKSNFKKIALDNSATGAGGGYRGNGGTLRQSPDIYSPLWLNSNINLPKDRPTINAWSRAFFALNGFVQNSISLHSTYPISKLNIKCKNEKVQKFFAEMIEEIDLMNICIQIAQEYWILGETFVYAELDESNRKWSRLLIQNPDYIVVKNSVVGNEPIISIRPDDNLKKICTSNNPIDIQQRQKLDRSIIEHVKRGENIPLNNFNVSHLARKINPYDVHGTGLIVSSFRPLMLFDKIYESKLAQFDNMINPLTLIKIGGEDYKPTPADLESWRQIFENAQGDKDFKIFTHDKVAVEKVGSNSAIMDTSGDITQLIKTILIGLMVPSVLMDGGSDTTYANGGVALDVLKQRYMAFRNMLTIWLRRKIFAPISKINDFYDYEDGKKVLIVPEVDWNHMALFDATDYIQILQQLADPEHKRVSCQTLYRSLGLVYEDEMLKIRQEDIRDAIREKEIDSLKNMSLNELRGLGPSDEIQEVVSPDGNLPGVSSPDGSSDLPGVPPSPLPSPESTSPPNPNPSK